MRKAEMSETQLKTRENIVSLFIKNNWEGYALNKLFENGYYVDAEATFRQVNPRKVELVVQVSFEENRIYLSLADKEGALDFIFHSNNKIQETSEAIVSFQDEISFDNFKSHLRKIKDMGVELYYVKDDVPHLISD